MVAAHVLLALVYLLGTIARHIHLAAKDGLEGGFALFFAFLIHPYAVVVELLDAEHVAMIGHRQALHAVADGLVDQVLDFRLAV